MALIKPKFIFLSAEISLATPLLLWPVKYFDFWFYLLFIYDKLLVMAPLLTLCGVLTLKLNFTNLIGSIRQGRIDKWLSFRLVFNLLAFVYVVNLLHLLIQLKRDL